MHKHLAEKGAQGQQRERENARESERESERESDRCIYHVCAQIETSATSVSLSLSLTSARSVQKGSTM